MANVLEMIGSPAQQGSKETITWDIATGSALAGGDTVSSPSLTAFIHSASSNSWASASDVLSGAATVSGSTISQAITSLSPGLFLIRVAFNAGGSKKLEGFFRIDCPI